MASYMNLLSDPIIITTVTPLFLLLVFLYVYKQQQTNGRKYYPVGGNVFGILINFNTMHDYMAHRAEKYKTYRMLSPLHREIFTIDPTNVEYILKTNFKNYGKVCVTS